MIPNRSSFARALAWPAIAAATLAIPGCGEETYKVQRGTEQLSKAEGPKAEGPKAESPKAAARIDKAQKLEDQFLKGKKLQ